MQNTITIGGVEHRVCDLKTEFTVRQTRKVFAILKQITGITDVMSSISKNGIPWDAVPELVVRIGETLGQDAVLELFCVFFIPVGERYDENKIEERKKIMEDAPVYPLIEAIKSFFPSRTTAAASTGGSSETR